MWAQALLLTSVLGPPLSYGAYLEYYYTTLLPTNTPLLLLALPIALQILTISLATFPIGLLYTKLGRRAYWKLLFAFAAVVAVASQITLYWITSYIGILVLQGLLLGSALGTLLTLGTLVLSSHYRGDVPLVSVQSGFAGFAGAVLHATLARFSLQGIARGNGYEGFSQAASGGLMGGTLLVAFFLLTRVKADESKRWSVEYTLHLALPRAFLRDLTQVKGMLWFIVGYMFISFGALVYPIYAITLLTQSPSLFSPDQGSYTLLAMLAVAALSASGAANGRVMRKVGPVNIFVAASMFAGAVLLAPVLYPRIYVSILLSGVYGIALGAILSLHMIVAAIFVSEKEGGRWADDMPAKVAIVVALGGISAFGGILVAAFIVRSGVEGANAALKVAGACMVGGGMLIWLVRLMRWKEKGVLYAV
jgi:hypothetical protein